MKETIIKIDSEEITVYLSETDRSAWLTVKEISRLYQISKATVYNYAKKIITELESVRHEGAKKLDSSLKSSFLIKGKSFVFYNLFFVLEVGEKIESNKGILLKEKIDELLTNENGIIIEKSPQNIRIFDNGQLKLDVEVSPEEDTVWLNQGQIALLFETTQQNISTHIKNIYEEGELDSDSVHNDSLYTDSVHKESLLTQKTVFQVAADGKSYLTTLYNLDVILAVGYRVKGKRAIEFRKWASSILKSYMINGYVIDEKRLSITNEDFANLVTKLLQVEKRVDEIEKMQEYSFVKDEMILDNEVFEGAILINKIVKTVKELIVLIDPYIDISTLDAFKNKNSDVSFVIITSHNHISHRELSNFKMKYGQVKLLFDKKFHDRYLVLDDTIFYHLGTSINYLGRRITQITIIRDEEIIEVLRNRINNLLKVQ